MELGLVILRSQCDEGDKIAQSVCEASRGGGPVYIIARGHFPADGGLMRVIVYLGQFIYLHWCQGQLRDK